VTMIVPDRAISGSVSRSWSFVSSAYTGGTDMKSIAAGHERIAHPSCLRCSNGMKGDRNVVDIDHGASLF
jgi:hypothetical protein